MRSSNEQVLVLHVIFQLSCHLRSPNKLMERASQRNYSPPLIHQVNRRRWGVVVSYLQKIFCKASLNSQTFSCFSLERKIPKEKIEYLL